MEDSKKTIRLLYLLFFLVAGIWLLFNRQPIVDQLVVWNFKPSLAVQQISDQVKFTPKGKHMFLAAQPQLDDRQDFNANCQKKIEKTIVLGCYFSPQRLYIYNVSDPQLAGIRQVTMAHEMLHVAYDRLDYAERQRVNRMIESALVTVGQTRPDLIERLKIYDKIEPNERINELHSILGTEVAVLPADLEQYYAQYFVNRSVITNFAAGYDKVFGDIKNQQDQLVAELNALSEEIDNLKAQYDANVASLNDAIESFNARANIDGSFETQSSFNDARDDLIYQRNVLEDQRIIINTKIDQYEGKRVILENLDVQVKDLNSKIDSSSVPSL